MNNAYMQSEIILCRQENANLSKLVNNRFAVIVNTNGYLGIQYWTESMITTGIQPNTDRTFSYFIEKL